jgi:hypothetical protein
VNSAVTDDAPPGAGPKVHVRCVEFTHCPVQRTKWFPLPGFAVSVRSTPTGTLNRVQVWLPSPVFVQEKLLGPVTLVVPKAASGFVSSFDTVTETLVSGSNRAVTAWSTSIVTVHVGPVLEHPVHPPKPLPLWGEAVKVTDVRSGNEAVHVVPQLMPAGELDTVPAPAPDLVTARSAKVVGTQVMVTTPVSP